MPFQSKTEEQPGMTELFHEQHQVEFLKGLWKKHGKLFIGAILLIAVILVGWSSWKGHLKDEKIEASIAYQTLLQDYTTKSVSEIDEQALAFINEYKTSTYSNLTRLLLARNYINAGDFQKAQKVLQQVIDNSSDSKEIQAIATIRLSRLLLDANKPAIALKLMSKKLVAKTDIRYNLIYAKIYSMQHKYTLAEKHYGLALLQAKNNQQLADFITAQLHNLPAPQAAGDTE
ncbi:MAG: hypothetical protein COB50_00915 [Thiotrichales bacterium]|nr:MAG: hypothetical protein COB50_00915 [Thiotrichales bacterium]